MFPFNTPDGGQSGIRTHDKTGFAILRLKPLDHLSNMVVPTGIEPVSDDYQSPALPTEL